MTPAGDSYGSSMKGWHLGTHRTRRPVDTVRDFGRLADVCGITRLADITGLDCLGVPVCAAIRPASKSLVVSLGKGLDRDAAMASALMEAIETWHAEKITPDVFGVTREELWRTGCNAADTAALPQAPDSTASTEPRSWIRGRILATGQEILVPFETVSMDFTANADTALLRSSNGLASGNHPDEALFHALCEVIERDGEALWRDSPDFRRLDLHTVTDRNCQGLIKRIIQAKMQIAAWDITSDVGIPAYGCLILPSDDAPDWATIGVHDGFGCHLSPAVALARAITEAAQTRLTYISGSRDDVLPDDIAKANDPELARQVRIDLGKIEATEEFRPEPAVSPSFTEDIAVITDALSTAGADDVICVDLTRPELGVPVVKVLVPGLEGPWEQSVPGPRREQAASGA
jgi:YcaO-like protein with predicted kinase domain